MNSVALRKESVDRNAAWVVIVLLYVYVALRKESVDRNQSKTSTIVLQTRRSPQGERG